MLWSTGRYAPTWVNRLFILRKPLVSPKWWWLLLCRSSRTLHIIYYPEHQQTRSTAEKSIRSTSTFETTDGGDCNSSVSCSKSAHTVKVCASQVRTKLFFDTLPQGFLRHLLLLPHEHVSLSEEPISHDKRLCMWGIVIKTDDIKLVSFLLVCLGNPHNLTVLGKCRSKSI